MANLLLQDLGRSGLMGRPNVLASSSSSGRRAWTCCVSRL